jgi:predicted amidohydrolase YtcJ
MDRIKIMCDGSLGANTAALLSSSDDKGDVVGVLYHATEDLRRMIQHARDLNFRVEIHAIGDAAVLQVLDALQPATGEEKSHVDRPLMTHCQVTIFFGCQIIHNLIQIYMYHVFRF